MRVNGSKRLCFTMDGDVKNVEFIKQLSWKAEDIDLYGIDDNLVNTPVFSSSQTPYFNCDISHKLKNVTRETEKVLKAPGVTYHGLSGRS